MHTQTKLNEILDLHKLYLIDPSKGKPADFSRMDLTGTKFHGVDLSDAKFAASIISKCEFKNCDLQNADFSGASGGSVTFNECDISYADFIGSKLHDSLIIDSGACKVDMQHAKLVDCIVIRTDLTEANFINAQLPNTQITDCDLINIIGNNDQIRSLQIGGYSVAYTSECAQIDDKQSPIDYWRMVWATNAENIKCVDCKRYAQDLIQTGVLLTTLKIIEDFPATSAEV